MISEQTPIAEVLAQFPEHRAKLIYQLRLAGLAADASIADQMHSCKMRPDGSLAEQLVATLNGVLQEPALMCQVRITEAAARQIDQIRIDEGKPQAALRIIIEGSSCSGYRYAMEFDDSRGEDDLMFEQHGMQLLVSLDDIGSLFGAEIDFHESAFESGFKINNPNKPRGGCRCSC